MRRAVDRDEEARRLLQVVLDGFPAQKTDLPAILRPYWSVHDRLAVEDGLVVCGCRLVIPRPVRAAVLSELHASHLGKEKTKSRARLIVYWPGLDNDIENITRTCQPCQRELPSLQRETLRTHEPAERPFQHLCADFCQHAGQYFLVTVDPLSGWLTVCSVGRHATASALIREMRNIFCTTGTPEVLWTDGGPQFTSRAFAEFLARWAVQHRVSSPHYPQSNGRAEAAVKYAAKLIRRVWNERGSSADSDAWARGILQHRNTPGPDGRSPAQIVFGRPVRDTIPAHRRSFAPRWQRAADEADSAATARQEVTRQAYDRHARDLRDLDVGSQVAVQDSATKRWDRFGIVTEVGPHRRYFVRLPSGRVLTRNRRFLRQRYGHATPELSAPDPVLPPPPAGDDAPAYQPPAEAPPPRGRPPAVEEGQGPPSPRRSSRVRRRPERLIETCCVYSPGVHGE